MTLKTLMQGPLPVTAPLVLNPLMAKMVEASGFSAGYLGGGATGYLKVVLEANLLGALCYRIVADPSTPLWAGYAAWKKVYADLADDFGAKAQKTDWTAVEHEVLGVIDIEKLLAVERATVEKDKA